MTMIRLLGRFALLSLSLGVAACQTFPDVVPGVCGNHVIDPSEDCDGTISVPHVAGLTCGAPGTAVACRYDCSADSSACPTGYFCGGDGICREPLGQYTALSSLPLANGHLGMADFNGDGRSDLISIDYDSGDVGVYFVETDGVVSGSFTTASDGVFPAAGWLDATKTVPSADLLVVLEGGLDVQRGQPDDSFAPTDYPTFDVSTWDNAYLIATDVIPGPAVVVPASGTPNMTGWNWIGDELLILHWDATKLTTNGNVYCAESPAAATGHFYDNPVLALPVTGPWPANVPLGVVDELAARSPCKQFVLPDPHLPRVVLVSPCMVDVLGNVGWNDNGKLGPLDGLALTYPSPVLTAPTGTVSPPTAVALAQVNPLVAGGPMAGHDDHLDLLIQATVGGQPQVFVAYGNGDGTFRSSPGGIADNLAVPLPGLEQLPLATGDFNGDGEIDLVTTGGLLLSSSTGYTVAAVPLVTGQVWSEALVVDFNGDGLPDLVAGSLNELGEQLFTNTPTATGTPSGVFNPDLVATSAPATSFVTGDFDGDLNVDIAFREGQVGGAAGLSVMFGRRNELPLSPQSLGELDGIDQVVSGVDLARRVPATGMSDLLAGTLTKGVAANARASVFPGRPDRTLQAPYFLAANPGAPLTSGISATATGLFHARSTADSPVPHPDVAALVTSMDDIGPSATPELWLLQASGAAQFKGALLGSTALPTTATWDSAVMQAIDVDGDGEDEIALLAPVDEMTSPPLSASELVVASVTATGFKLVFSAQLPVGLFERHPAASTTTTTMVERRNERLCVADVDGDTHLDLVALTASPTTGLGQVTILWGSGDAAAPFTNVAKPYVITLPEEAKAFTCIDVDGKGGMDLVIVGAASAYLAYGSAAPTAAVLGGVQLTAAGLSVTTGNIDDDNIADLVISNASSATIFLGKAVIK